MRNLASFFVTFLVLAAQTKLPIGLEVKLPKDWTTKRANQAMLLIPPGGSGEPNVDELYAVTILPGARNVRDPFLKQQFESQFLPAQLRARSLGIPVPFEGVAGQGLLHTWEFTTPSTGAPGRLQIFVIGLNGGGVAALMSLGRTALVRLHDSTMMSMAISLASVAEEASAVRPDEMSLSAEEWRTRLNDKMLIPAVSGDSAPRLYLRKNGRFEFKGQQSSKGTWRIYTQSSRTYLELRDESGVIEVNDLKLHEGAIMLDERRMHLTEPK